MKKELRWAAAALMLLGLSGCGLKGPLYFPPEDKPAVTTAPPDSNNDVQRNQQPTSGTQGSTTADPAGL
ncbi:lipoprotein [Nissabacter sp. SGAir0207]|uniref:LPS translocon maturation chaperone LptM n=1 Tax=Nissabacter sp. SGAir0207 TaxID=2126321 RepID=UPI0010CCCC7C|nr:lipoprotein [Nissabacter sp. SGAir0207]QCR37553.1 hypothetical protein C1N62_16490 [Nissabacter sp. SGAir0207]